MSDGSAIRTVRDALAWARAQRPDESPVSRDLEIDRLLSHVLGVLRHEIHISPDRPLAPREVERFRSNWLRRLTGVPLQILIGETEFYSLDFGVSPGVFVPRPETESLVEAVVRECTGTGETWIDVGTGTGVIAVSLAVSVESLVVFATDVSPEALNLATRNARRQGVEDRVRFARCDLLDAFTETGRVDGIVSNPPYIAPAEIPGLPVEVREHDPHAALLGGEDGLALIRRLVADAPRVLRPAGCLALEIGDGQADDVRALFDSDSRWQRVRILNDLTSRPRVALARTCQTCQRFRTGQTGQTGPS